MKQIRTRIAALWPLALLLLWSAAAIGAETVRLAIIPEEPALAAVADLFTVTLSTNRQVALVEREQLDRVLREQAIASANGRDFIKLGQLLGADGLVRTGRAGLRRQYFGTLGSISWAHARIPPRTLFTDLKPCCLRNCTALSERTPRLQWR